MVRGSAPKLYLKVPIHLPFYLFSVILNKTILITIGTTGSPSLVVMGGLMFQRLWVQIPAPYTGWTFFAFICCKIVVFV